MTLPKVGVMYEPASAATLHDIVSAAAGRCEPVMLFQDATARANPNLLRVSRLLAETVVASDAAFADTAGSLRLAGVTTFRDALLDLTDAVVRELGLPGATGGSAWDKLVQRNRLHEYGLSTFGATAVDSADDFRRAADRLDRPAVLKPRRGAASRGVAFIDGPADAAYQLATRRHWTGLLLEARIDAGSHPSGIPWLADYVSVETVSTADRHHHVAIFDKLPLSVARRVGPDGADSVIECGDILPSRLPDDQATAVTGYVSRCLDALRVSQRVTHAEIRLTPGGPEVIEINGRVGGLLARVLRLTGGVDLVAAALQVAAGGEPDLPRSAMTGCAMGLTLPFRQREGTVRSEVGVPEVRTLPGVVGVDEVAGRGRLREAADHRAVNLTLAAATLPELDRALRDTVQGLAGLFTADALALPDIPC